jgi:transcription initiation factor TFIIIB Brf1 subunit/transcription initiation factor TFIIB
MYGSTTEIEKCTDCGSPSLRIIHGDLTCTGCGLVLEGHIFEDCPEYHDAEAVQVAANDHMQRNKTKQKVIVDANTSTSGISGFKDTFECITKCTGVHESVIQQAQGILTQYLDCAKTHIKGYERRLLYAAVCVYFACKDTNGGGRTKDQICNDLGLGVKGFAKASTQVREVLGHTVMAKAAMATGTRFDDQLNRFISSLNLPTPHVRDLRKTTHRLYTKVKPFEATLCCATQNLVATLLYMGCMYLKLNVKMKDIVHACCVSSTTIIQYEAMIKDLLMTTHARKDASI